MEMLKTHINGEVKLAIELILVIEAKLAVAMSAGEGARIVDSQPDLTMGQGARIGA